MRVQCDRCGSSYTLPETRVAPGKRLQFQCRACQHRIIVQVPEEAAAAPAPAAPPAAPAPPPAKILWFVTAAGGQQLRLDTDGVRAAIAEGAVSGDSWLWRKGMAEWSRAAEVADFASSFAEPSPTSAMEPIAVASPEPESTMASSQAVVEMNRPAVLSGSHVAGAASVHKGSGFQTDQRAIAMPIVRVASEGAEPVQRDQRQRPAQRDSEPRPNRQPAGRHTTDIDTENGRMAQRRGGQRRDNPEAGTASYAAMGEEGEDGPRASKGPWSPATDTYQGQRARMTRKVDDRDRRDAVEWAAATERRDNELRELRDSLRAWQRLAFAGLIALVVVLLLTALMTLKWRDAAAEAAACKPAAPFK